jgi:DNA (cytosine-5)-methyltransferase 1
MNEMIPTIDLFAGAGGIGIGAHMAGGNLLLSLEINELCCDTLVNNSDAHPGRVITGDVDTYCGQELRELAGLSGADTLVIIGGPPCQPFSKASYWTDPGADSRYRQARAKGIEVDKPIPILNAKEDERRNLVDVFLNRVIEANADGFLMENVASILHPRNMCIVNEFIQKAEHHGFKCNLIKANAADYGVPQVRQRVFVLAAKSKQPLAPMPTHSDQSIDGQLEIDMSCYVTAGEALNDFSSDDYFEPEEIVSGKWEKEFHQIPPGMNYKALSAWAGHPNPVFVAETRFWNFLLKLSPNKPSWTIAASPGPWTGPFHWHGRRLRTVEMAALQTFPKQYRFSGTRRERVRQIGNAAPPLLVKHMIGKVYEAI